MGNALLRYARAAEAVEHALAASTTVDRLPRAPRGRRSAIAPMYTPRTREAIMERITQQQLEARVANVNRRIESSGRGVQVQKWGAHGYTRLDEYKRDPDATLDLPDSVPGRGYGWIIVRTLTVGTKGEVGEFLHAMMVGIDIYLS